MKIERASAAQVCEVAYRMREADYAEFSAVSTAADREELALILAGRYGDEPAALCALKSGVPVAIGATLETRPNVLTLMFFATDAFAEIAFPLTRFIRQRLLKPMIAAGVHRVEAVSMVGHDKAHRWIRALGLEPETEPLLGYGRAGEAFLQFSWVRDDVRSLGA